MQIRYLNLFIGIDGTNTTNFSNLFLELNEGNHFIGLIEVRSDLHQLFVKLLSRDCVAIVVLSECQSIHDFVIIRIFDAEFLVPLFL
jgi:hypothetical protein